MDLLSISIVAGGLLLYSLVSGRLEGTVLTAPLLFVAFGFLIGPGGFGLADIDVEHSSIHVIAELTLILVLFTDAARIDLNRVRRDHNLPMRMLLIGLPLTIAAGALICSTQNEESCPPSLTPFGFVGATNVDSDLNFYASG